MNKLKYLIRPIFMSNKRWATYDYYVDYEDARTYVAEFVHPNDIQSAMWKQTGALGLGYTSEDYNKISYEEMLDSNVLSRLKGAVSH